MNSRARRVFESICVALLSTSALADADAPRLIGGHNFGLWMRPESPPDPQTGWRNMYSMDFRLVGRFRADDLPGGGLSADLPQSAFFQEKWTYQLEGGTIVVEVADLWIAFGLAGSAVGKPAPPRGVLGFGRGVITHGTGRYSSAVGGTVEMRFLNGQGCICTFHWNDSNHEDDED